MLQTIENALKSDFYDNTKIKKELKKELTLMENNILGQRETHRLVLDVSTIESWRMGKVKKKL